MNIMLLIFSFNVGGIERQMTDMAREMIRKGHHVCVCVINRDYTESLLKELPERCVLHLLDKPVGTKNFLPWMNRLSGIIGEDHTQILHCQGVNCVLFAAIAKLRHPHLVVLNTVHTCGNFPSYSAAKIFFQNRICSMTIAISEAIRKEVLSRNVKPEKVVTIYNAIDMTKFAGTPRSGSFSKRRKDNMPGKSGIKAMNSAESSDMRRAVSSCGQPTGRIEIGEVGRIYPAQKGQDTLVEAVLKLLPEYPDLHCTFAGDVFKGQEEAVRKLQEKIRDHHAEGNFSFPGNIDDVPSFLKTLDIFVLPSHSEAFGIALVEAMAAGLPCIASNLAGPAEIINDPRLGLLFTPGDADDLAQAINFMIQHAQDYDPAYISENVRKRFSIEDMVQKHLDLYERLLK